MKTQITQTLTKDNSCDYELEDNCALCGSFVQTFFPDQLLPDKIKVTATIRKRAFKDAKAIFVRHQMLGAGSPSSWTWKMMGNTPVGFGDGGGMFGPASRAVTELLGDKLSKLSPGADHLTAGVPIYIRVVKI